MRIGFIDGMRGFAIFLVILGHVLLMGFNLGHALLTQIIYSFHMPLFFFISGYVAYNNRELCLRREMINKTMTLVVPASLFYATFAIIHDVTYNTVMNRGGGIFMGYWFTFVLFEFFMVYYLAYLIGRYTTDAVMTTVLVISSIVCAVMVGFGYVDGTANIIKCFEGVRFTEFLQFFVFGIICKKYNAKFLKIVKEDWFTGVCLLLLLATMTIFFKKFISPYGALMWMVRTTIPYLAILLSFSLFYYYENFFQSDYSKWSRGMRFIGRRTLDIYFIHYFFIPNMPYITSYLDGRLILQLILGSLLTISIMAVSIFIGEIIRKSTFTSRYLLGIRKKH